MSKTGYSVNSGTRIGREIDKIIKEEENIKKIFETSGFVIGFLTSEKDKRKDKNIQIFHQNRLEKMKNPTEDYIAIPGCISNSIIANVDFLFPEGTKEVINIEVTFGSKASSSRQEKNKITSYEINTHKQIPEIELVTGKKVILKHSLDTHKEETKIKIGNAEVEVDTVRVTAVHAINMAINSFIDFEVKKEK